ncbi:hypothetical protein D0817_20875 [Flavobacterium cupreum]|uniref:Uncharacterized protein n=1 Tax=Flavobacterium cupreum TaxID=2133766 RepID=A0A434A2F7_9FLAO|nr:hypothetical protein D0817_20875 [Flavobacterium cupreum]
MFIALINRSQGHNPKTEQWVKINNTTGRFMDLKQDDNSFKGVTKSIPKIFGAESTSSQRLVDFFC